MTATANDYIKLHFIVFLWGFTGVLGNLISVPTIEMILLRTSFAVVGMAAVIWYTQGTLAMDKKDLAKILLTGIIVAAHWLAFFISCRIANPSTGLVGFATCSFWAALIEPFAKRRKIQILEVGLGVFVLIGLYIIFSFNFQYPFGLFLGIVSGFLAALFNVINSKLVTRVNAHTITFYEMLSAGLFLLLILPFAIHGWDDGTWTYIPSWLDILYVALMGWVCTVFAYSAAINLSRKLSVFYIQLALNLEPIYGITLAILVFGNKEVMAANFYLGTLIILLAVASYPFLKKRLEAYSR